MTDTLDAPPVPSLPRVIGTKYRISERIGEGGMGVVYAADHLELHTKVALKVLQPKLAPNEAARARVVREARLAASIQSEHSTRIYDVGLDPADGPYIVMERLVGRSVEERLEKTGPLPLEEACMILLQALDAVAEAHARGLVHRDLKPANLFMVDRPGEPVWVKVLDFGISKAIAAEPKGGTPTITEPHTILGSPHYMSPEQLRDSNAVDARSDLWACGVILHELLTGKMPFEAPSLADLCVQIVTEPPLPLIGPGIPVSIVRLVERCLRKDPAERPATAFDIAEVLAPHASPSGRASLSRIGAWCKRASVDVTPVRFRAGTYGGLALVAAAGLLAFVAASFRAPRSQSVGGGASAVVAVATPPPVRTLDPIARLAPIASTAETPPAAPAPAPGPSAQKPSASPTTATPKPPRPVRPTEPGRVRDLDNIDLIR